MRLTIKTTHIELTAALRVYVEQKLGEIERFLKNIEPHDDNNLAGKHDPIELRVEIGKPSRHHKSGKVFYAEANLDLPGRVIRAESRQFDLHIAIDEVRKELKREIKTYKEKTMTLNRQGGRKAKALRAL